MSETPEKSSASFSKIDRTAEIGKIILKSLAACCQPLLDPESHALRVMIAAWSEVLSDIPTERLNDCYLIAIRRHGSSFPLGAGEIAIAYQESSTDRIGETAASRQIVSAPREYFEAREKYRDSIRKQLTAEVAESSVQRDQ